MDRTEVVNSLANSLYSTEQSIDDAVMQATRLIQSMIETRSALEVSPVAGAESQAKAVAALAALGTARDAIVACHAELQKDHRRMGWGTYAVGPVNKPEEGGDKPFIRPTGHLRVAS